MASVKQGCTFPLGQRRVALAALPCRYNFLSFCPFLCGFPLHVPLMAHGGYQCSYWEEEGSREEHKGCLPNLLVPFIKQFPRTRLSPSDFRLLQVDHPICKGGYVCVGHSVVSDSL